jgi:hypothetical protein
MSDFPLYENMCKKIPKRDLSVKKKMDLIKNIKLLDENGYELLYTLIKVHNQKNDTAENYNKLPYDGKFSGEGDIEYDLLSLPITLRHIIYKFVNLHISSMKENALKNKPFLGFCK